jgi:glycosyltransferase involved in cell wall biosynthesis
LQPPAVSVLIPTFSRVRLLARAIESVCAQTFEDWELVVVDDGPSQEIAELVRAEPDPRVRLVRHAENRGVAAARNTGIAASSGRYVAFLDDDDIWLEAKLERQFAEAERHDHPVVHTLVYVASGSGEIFERPSERGFRLFREVAAAGYPYSWLLRRSSFQINSFLVRRRCIDGIGGFDETLSGVDDLDFVHRLRRAYDLHLLDEPLVKYCFHSENQGNTKDPNLWVRLAHKELARLDEAEPGERRGIEAFLHRQLALAAWIDGRSRDAARPALHAHALDPSVLPRKVLLKYLAGAALPAAAVRMLRARVREARAPAEPDPWLDLG